VKDFVLPSQIPWDRLRGKDFEECVYWLLDSMGAKDLNWRVGGEGGGSADQGRDLECLFYHSGPEDDLERQRRWIEVKGRKGTLESEAVKAAVNNAIGHRGEVDVLVIVTNTLFSNPTRGWVKNNSSDSSHTHCETVGPNKPREAREPASGGRLSALRGCPEPLRSTRSR
jgi:hypothetical protein